MRLVYLSISYVPSRSASSVHAMKMCSALVREGHQVVLVTKLAPGRQEPDVHDDFAFYGVADDFTVAKLRRPERRGGGLVYSLAVRRFLARERDIDLVYSRDLVGAWIAAVRGHPVIFEAHGLPKGRAARSVTRRLLARPELERVVLISDALERLWREKGLLDDAPESLVAHDGSDPMESLERSRATDAPLRAGYVGHLYAGRGIELMLETARRLPEIELQLVGGRERDLETWRAAPTPENVDFRGFLPPAELPQVYADCDLLLMPYQRSVGVRSGRSDTARWMSPMKMFEYMAAGRAIVSSDLPVLREVLENGRNALLVDPEDPDAWSAAVRTLAGDPELRARLGNQAREDLLARYTWTARARSVLAGIA